MKFIYVQVKIKAASFRRYIKYRKTLSFDVRVVSGLVVQLFTVVTNVVRIDWPGFGSRFGHVYFIHVARFAVVREKHLMYLIWSKDNQSWLSGKKGKKNQPARQTTKVIEPAEEKYEPANMNHH